MKRFIALLLAMALCVGLVACGSSDEGKKEAGTETTSSTEKSESSENTENSSLETTKAEPTTLVYGSGNYTRINPAMDEHCEINVLLFDGLTDHDGDNNIIPRLAKSWEYDEATYTYTFHLEEGVKWHDGAEFTADDVKFTIEAIMDPENGAENAPNYEDVETITVVDPYTVQFKLSAPNYAFLEYMTMAVLPKHLLEGESMQESAFFRAPIGTGPYKLTEWDEGQAIIMEKNAEYFAGPAKIDRIIFKIVPDDTAKAVQLQDGSLNLSQVTPKDAVLFENDGTHTVYDEKTSDYRGILYNFWNPYWTENADLIPAISYAVDRQAIIDAVLLGYGEIGYGPLQRNIYNSADVEHYDYNPIKAEELLVAAGCEKDAEGFYCRGGERISIVINATPGDQVRVDMAQIVAQQLRSIGLDVTANVPAGGIDWGGQQCCIIGWGSPFDADDHTYKVFGTDKGANYSGYSNELVDQYLTEARQTDVPEERAAAYAKFQTELANKPAYTFFCYIDAMYVADSNIHGIATDTILGHHGVGIFWNVCDWTID